MKFPLNAVVRKVNIKWPVGWCCCVRMNDDDSCVMNLIEIVPIDNNRNCFESPDVNMRPRHIKVCTHSLYTLLVNNCVHVVCMFFTDA